MKEEYNDKAFGPLFQYLDLMSSTGQKVTPKTHAEFWEKKEDEFWDKRCKEEGTENID